VDLLSSSKDVLLEWSLRQCHERCPSRPYSMGQVFRENSVVTLLLMNSSAFMEPHSWLLCTPPALLPIFKKITSVPTLGHISSRTIVILSCHLFPYLPSGFSPSGFPTKKCYAFLISTMRFQKKNLPPPPPRFYSYITLEGSNTPHSAMLYC